MPLTVLSSGLPSGLPSFDRLTLPMDPRSAAAARRRVRQVCLVAGLPGDVCDAAELLTSEIVTNAVVHGRSEARLCTAADHGVVRVEVADDNSRRPVRVRADDQALDGRGLALVEAVATSWGVSDDACGKTIWFELHASHGSPESSGSPES